MPSLCNYPQCGLDALPSKRYCALHHSTKRTEVNRRNAQNPNVIKRQSVYKNRRFKKVTTPIVMARDEYMCVLCGEAEDTKLLIDHIDGLTYTDADFDPDRCQVLCFVCSGRKDGGRAHKTSHRGVGRT